MDVVVCVKQVPDVAEAELEIAKDGRDISTEDLVMDINEWDNYAVEEAVRLKETYGGKVTVITLGDEDSEDVLRRALAMGADEALLIDEEDFKGSDAAGIARGLAGAVKDLGFDILLTGVQSSDDGWAQVGVALAEYLSLPYASMAVGIDIEDKKAVVTRELESNTLEKVEISLPGVVTVQTGINEPRYVSVMGIRKVRKIEIQEKNAGELGLSSSEIGPEGSCIASRTLTFPPEGEGAEILTGNLSEVCEKVAGIIRDKGGVS